jgi:7-carboxy-7-deazaguanine synthase
MSVAEVLSRVAEEPGENVCITGGEPTMQPAELLDELVTIMTDDVYTIDMFTNGSLKAFPEWITLPQVTVIMDWKLQGSGEADRGIGIRIQNVKRLQQKDAVKFVIASEDDFHEAVDLWQDMRHQVDAPFYVGAAWGLIPEAKLVEWVLANNLPWKLNVQVHKFIWPGIDRGI